MRRVFYVFLRVAVGMLFMASGYSKLLAPYQDFVAAIHGYRILTGAPALWLAIALPWAELAAGLYAMLGLWTRFSLTALWMMNLMFLAAVSSAVLRRLPLESCGCFGEGGFIHFSPHEILLLDLTLTLVFILLLRDPRAASAYSLDAVFSKSTRSSLP